MEKPEAIKVIVEDADGITIAMRHEWQRIQEDNLGSLRAYSVVRCVISTNGVYQIMKDIDPLTFLSSENGRSNFKLVKYATDEKTGKIIILAVDICEEEAKELATSTEQFT